jgi:Protein of unknown function (DUF1579)
MESTKTQQTPAESMMNAQPQKEHRWLLRLVGDWTYESDLIMEPGKDPMKCTGTESVRSLGDLWILGEGTIEMPGGGPATTLLTLGYNPETKRFVGTWVGSMMTHMWVYDGELDSTEKILTLSAEGPDFETPGKTAKYKDVVDFKNDDERVLSSHVLGPDGQWTQFMTANYRRTK